MYKNFSGQKVSVYAYNIANNTAITGGSSAITAYISKDGAAAAQSNDVNPSEIDPANMQGVYTFDLTQEETNCDLFLLSPKSSNSNAQIDPVSVYTINTSMTISSNLVSIGGSATVDNETMLTWAKRLYISLVRPFTADATAKTKAFKDNAGDTDFTHTYDADNSRSLS